MSNAASAAMIVTVRQTPISYRRLGIVIDLNSWNQLAPSIRADSYSAASIFVMPVSSRTMQNPSSTQIPMRPTAGQRGVEVAQPGAGHVAQADRGEELIDEPGQGQQPTPDDAGRDQRHHLRQEQHRPRGRPESPGRDPVDHARRRRARATRG